MKKTAALILFLSYPALAHDGFEGVYRKDPRSGASIACCGGRDCSQTETRRGPNGQLQAHINPGPLGPPFWIDIPPETEVPVELNPLAGPAICWLPERGVICYFPGRAM